MRFLFIKLSKFSDPTLLQLIRYNKGPIDGTLKFVNISVIVDHFIAYLSSFDFTNIQLQSSIIKNIVPKENTLSSDTIFS